MPRIKRWFPVSHDINRDPELWALREKHGEKALSVWLELLSIADRNEGEISGSIEEISRAIAWPVRCKHSKVLSIINDITTVHQWVINTRSTDEHGNIKERIRVLNYAKYHRTREHQMFPPNLPNQTEPIKENKEKKKPPEKIPWPDADRWLLTAIDKQWFLTHCNGSLDDYAWWADCDKALGGINPDFVEKEFSKMSAYFREGHPLKTANGMKRFIRTWLERAKNRGGLYAIR